VPQEPEPSAPPRCSPNGVSSYAERRPPSIPSNGGLRHVGEERRAWQALTVHQGLPELANVGVGAWVLGGQRGFSADGKRIVNGSADNVKMWNVSARPEASR